MLLNRRRFLKGASATGALIRIGLPPLAAMFNFNGTAYAAANKKKGAEAIESRFLVWFNGNGIPERYWIPETTGPARNRLSRSSAHPPMLPQHLAS